MLRRRTQHTLVDLQLGPICDLLRTLLHAADVVVQEALEVEDEDGRELVEEDLLLCLGADAARGEEVGELFRRRDLLQRVLNADDVVGLR